MASQGAQFDFRGWPEWLKSLVASVTSVVGSAIFFEVPAPPPLTLNSGVAYAVTVGALVVLVLANLASAKAHRYFARRGLLITIALGAVWLVAISVYYFMHFQYVTKISGEVGKPAVAVTISHQLSALGFESLPARGLPACKEDITSGSNPVSRSCANAYADDSGEDHPQMFDEGSVATNEWVLFVAYISAALSFSLMLTFALLRYASPRPA